MSGNRRALLSVLLLVGAAAAAAASGDTRWNESVSPHFSVYHESAFMPPGLLLELGGMHNRLRRDLAMFTPWMANKRIKIYLYSDSKSYLRGEFQPPTWSNGVAYYDRKIIVAHEQPDSERMFAVLAHELTHLLFESYWAEEKKEPPVWLNEGLSMMEEATDPKNPEKSQWYQAMWVLTDAKPIPFKQFFAISPTRDLSNADKDTVSLWYVQAYAIVYFLYRRHSRMNFSTFCASLREGKPLKDAVWKAYRFSSMAKFERAWRDWLDLPEVREKIKPKRRSRVSASAPPPQTVGKQRTLKHVGFRNFQFHGLVPDR